MHDNYLIIRSFIDTLAFRELFHGAQESHLAVVLITRSQPFAARASIYCHAAQASALRPEISYGHISPHGWHARAITLRLQVGCSICHGAYIF